MLSWNRNTPHNKPETDGRHLASVKHRKEAAMVTYIKTKHQHIWINDRGCQIPDEDITHWATWPKSANSK